MHFCRVTALTRLTRPTGVVVSFSRVMGTLNMIVGLGVHKGTDPHLRNIITIDMNIK
uniref:Uncharacterized protein n=1 Tax=Candidatus Kentrum sp. SD TaxID=2126332 RepID=A0A451BLC8_9GAMM|nr:MAG: hypothetical protein BECKSD772D_GA0070982_103414 [Candidatus Kentron sp. SD]